MPGLSVLSTSEVMSRNECQALKMRNLIDINDQLDHFYSFDMIKAHT